MNSDWIESELENCLTELRSICDHLEPPPGRWQKPKTCVVEWWLCNEVGETLFSFAVWIGLLVGVPLLCSICGSNKSSDLPKSPHGDVVTQYTVIYYEDGAQEWEEANHDAPTGTVAQAPEIRRAIPIACEIRRAIPIEPEIRKAIPLQAARLRCQTIHQRR